jgi:hypothetical protein
MMIVQQSNEQVVSDDRDVQKDVDVVDTHIDDEYSNDSEEEEDDDDDGGARAGRRRRAWWTMVAAMALLCVSCWAMAALRRAMRARRYRASANAAGRRRRSVRVVFDHVTPPTAAYPFAHNAPLV